MAQQRSIPSLDGLRAVAITLVVLAHASYRPGSPLPPGLTPGINWGNLGVRIFFVISGYLITRLLIAEHAKHGRISLPAFYWRRTTRIFPPLYAFLLVVAVASTFGYLPATGQGIAAAGAYLSNYLPVGPTLGHTWSLSVEEQFYLLWPAAMLWAGVRHGWKVALGVVLAGPFVRVAEYWITDSTDGILYRFEAVADNLAIGCLMAYAQPWITSVGWWNRALRNGAGYLLPIGIIAGMTMGDHPLVSLGAAQTVTMVSTALLVDWVVRYPESWAGLALNWTPIRALGIGSYSLYLWQQPFLYGGTGAWWEAWPANLVLAVSCAVVSYYLVEQPALRLRKALEVRWRGRERVAAHAVSPAP